jgi:hypothetical protein
MPKYCWPLSRFRITWVLAWSVCALAVAPRVANIAISIIAETVIWFVGMHSSVILYFLSIPPSSPTPHELRTVGMELSNL